MVAYDGTNYCGWQLQPNCITVEQVLNESLSELLKEDISVIGASRTDSGVHAEGNIAVFDTNTKIPSEKISFALNQRLPEDIRIQHSEEVPENFHPRHRNSIKTYEYRILNRRFERPTLRWNTYFVYIPLEVERMREAAAYLTGEHDFKAFSSSKTQVQDTYRIIYCVFVEQKEDIITIRISGNGFLYNMVRLIAGTLIEIGKGRYEPSYIKTVLDSRDRTLAGPKAPALGLTLMGIEYEKELPNQMEIHNSESSYILKQDKIQTEGIAILQIEWCRQDIFLNLIERSTIRALRNGAHIVYLIDKEKRIDTDSITAGEYRYYKCQDSDNMGDYRCITTCSLEPALVKQECQALGVYRRSQRPPNPTDSR